MSISVYLSACAHVYTSIGTYMWYTEQIWVKEAGTECTGFGSGWKHVYMAKTRSWEVLGGRQLLLKLLGSGGSESKAAKSG